MKENIGRPISIALQGGGSHGAFTWGVLDRLLESGYLDIRALSGTSAGAMNAVALADGWACDGAEGARQSLYEFWHAVGRKGRFSPIQRTPWDILTGSWSITNSPGYMLFDTLSRAVSPYLANPFDFNPLREVVESEIDFNRIRTVRNMQIFISATNVETGEARVFQTHEIDADVVMASACLPYVFKAVEIDGIPYWDGGYGGNPALYPFFQSAPSDVLLVQINPIRRAGTPKSAREIQNRIDEITFNSSLLREFRAIAFVKKLIAEGKLDKDEYRDIRMHRIDADDALQKLSASSKVNAEMAFLEYLRDLGRAAAQDWLESDYPSVGYRPTVDLSIARSPALEREARRGPGSAVRNFMKTSSMPRSASG